jgi:hypothetical protein
MTKQTSNKFSPEVRERAVRMVFDHQTEHSSQWATITSIASPPPAPADPSVDRRGRRACFLKNVTARLLQSSHATLVALRLRLALRGR